MAAHQQQPEEIPLLSAQERAEVDFDAGGAPVASGVRQRTFKDAAVNPPPYGQGAGPSAPIPGSGATTGKSSSGTGVSSSTGSTSGTGSSIGKHGNSLLQKAEGDVKGVVGLVTGGVSSGAWLYPIRGVIYLLTHPNLLFPILPTLVKAAGASLLVLFGCFFFFYLPQVAFLAIFTGPLAFLGAIPLVLGEAYLIISWLSKAFLLTDVGDDLFDAVLVNRGQGRLVEATRPVKTWSGGKVLGRLAKRTASKLSADNIVPYVLTLPLNFIPVVGTAFFLGYNGYKSGPSWHHRYFELKGWGPQEVQAFVQKRRAAYAAFGTTATIFNLVPVVSVFLSLGSNVGAALWASDIESGGRTSTAEDVLDVALPPSLGGSSSDSHQAPGPKKEL